MNDVMMLLGLTFVVLAATALFSMLVESILNRKEQRFFQGIYQEWRNEVRPRRIELLSCVTDVHWCDAKFQEEYRYAMMDHREAQVAYDVFDDTEHCDCEEELERLEKYAEGFVAHEH